MAVRSSIVWSRCPDDVRAVESERVWTERAQGCGDAPVRVPHTVSTQEMSQDEMSCVYVPKRSFYLSLCGRTGAPVEVWDRRDF